MRIVHLCGTAYIDNWGYQDNLLPQYQAELGHEVHVIAPGNRFPRFIKQEERDSITAKGSTYTIGNVHIHRISTYIHTNNFSFIYLGLFRKLVQLHPDMIFNHGVAAPLLSKATLYKCLHKHVKLVIDNHADYINCSKNKIWRSLYIKGFERIVATLCSPFITKAYGVTKMRCDYLCDVYGFSRNKVKLLPIGADTNLVKSITLSKEELKNKYHIYANHKVIISGGKMGTHKGTESLIKAFQKLRLHKQDVNLILFGVFEDKETECLALNTDGVINFGWCDRKTTLELLKLADIACWPIHHTTLIEDAVACSTPLILRKTGNTEHLIDGNGIFVSEGRLEDLLPAICEILSNYNKYHNSALLLSDKYSYSSISKVVINDCTRNDFV